VPRRPRRPARHERDHRRRRRCRSLEGHSPSRREHRENVGRAFAEEARKIHYEEAPRGIRGQATPEEAESLRDEGIDFLSLPGILGRELD
jgi:hypothetical protein